MYMWVYWSTGTLSKLPNYSASFAAPLRLMDTDCIISAITGRYIRHKTATDHTARGDFSEIDDNKSNIKI